MDINALGKPNSELPFMEELTDLQILDSTKDVFLNSVIELLANKNSIPFIILSTAANTIKYTSDRNVIIDGVLSMIQIIKSEPTSAFIFIEDILQKDNFKHCDEFFKTNKVRFLGYRNIINLKGKYLATICIYDTKPRRLKNGIQKAINNIAEIIERDLSYHDMFKNVEAKFHKSFFFDPLTGLPNLKLFLERLDQAILGKKKNSNDFFFRNFKVF